MNQHTENLQHITRRHFLRQGQMGLGAVALGALMKREGLASPVLDVDPLAPRRAGSTAGHGNRGHPARGRALRAATRCAG